MEQIQTENHELRESIVCDGCLQQSARIRLWGEMLTWDLCAACMQELKTKLERRLKEIA